MNNDHGFLACMMAYQRERRQKYVELCFYLGRPAGRWRLEAHLDRLNATICFGSVNLCSEDFETGHEDSWISNRSDGSEVARRMGWYNISSTGKTKDII